VSQVWLLWKYAPRQGLTSRQAPVQVAQRLLFLCVDDEGVSAKLQAHTTYPFALVVHGFIGVWLRYRLDRLQAKNLDQLLGFSSPMDHTKYDRYGASPYFRLCLQAVIQCDVLKTVD